MNRHLTSAAVVAALVFVSSVSWAQSPWETGSYKTYAPSAGAGSGGTGLDGFFASPPAPKPDPATDKTATPTTPDQAPSPPPAQDTQADQVDYGPPKDFTASGDQGTITNALQASDLLVQMAQVAQAQSKSDDVQQMAGSVANLIQPLADSIRSAAAEGGARVDSKLDIVHGQYLARLKTATGDFDATYVSLTQSMLNTLAYELDKEVKTGQSKALKSIASSNAPAVRKEAATLTQPQSASK